MKRGGNWNNSATNVRVANRNANNPGNRNNNLGFRLASTRRRRPPGAAGQQGARHGERPRARDLSSSGCPRASHCGGRAEDPTDAVGPNRGRRLMGVPLAALGGRRRW